MPSSVGPNIIGENNIVLAYDTGDTVNSYKGEPTTNLYTTLGFGFYQQEGNHSAVRTTGPAPDLTLPSNYDYTTVTTTGNWQSEVNRLIIWTDSSLSSGTYNISFWARVTSTASATIGCAFYGNSLNQSMSLTTQWQRFSIQSTTHSAYRATEFGSLSGAIVFQIAGLQIEAISHVTPYVNGTRSVTQGLLPIISNTSLDLTNVSFNSNAQIIWDGTNDYIDVSSFSSLEIVDDVTIEAVIKANTSNLGSVKVIANKYSGTGWEFVLGSSGNFALGGRNGDGSYYSSDSGVVIADNTYHHIVGIKTGIYWKTYVDGALKSTTTAGSVGTLYNTTAMQLGREGSSYYTTMNLDVFKVYNRPLTSFEIQQNYKQYKSRFNLS